MSWRIDNLAEESVEAQGAADRWFPDTPEERDEFERVNELRAENGEAPLKLEEWRYTTGWFETAWERFCDS